MYIFKTLFGGTLFIIMALIVGPWLMQNFDPSLPEISLGWAKHAGGVVGILSLLFGLYSAMYLILPGRSCPAPYEAGGAFTVFGPYRYIRNPIMLSIVIAIWGEAFYYERLSLLIYAFLFTWLAHAWVLFFEEPALRSALKRTYSDYQKSVPRWLPRFKGYKE